MHNPEQFLITHLTDAKTNLAGAFDPNKEFVPETLYEGTSSAIIAYLTDALIGAGLADKVREVIELTAEDGGESLLRYATTRLTELGDPQSD